MTEYTRHPDRRFLWAVSAVLILATGLPYLFAPLTIPAGKAYSGLHFQNTGDWNVYFSSIEQVRQGRIAVANAFSTTDDRPVLLMPIWLFIGLLARFTGLPTVWAYHLVRIALLPILVIVVSRVLQRLGPLRSWRFALVFFLFAGGFGAASGLTDLIPFTALFFSPHYVVAWILYALVLLLIPAAAQRRADAVFLAGVETLLVLTIPYVGIVGFLTILVFLVLAHRAWRTLIGVSCLLVPIALYNLLLSGSADIQAYLEQNVTVTPSPFALALGLGFLVPLCLFGFRTWRRVSRPLLLVGAVSLAWSYLPVPFQHRFLFPVPLAVAVLAGPATAAAYRWLRSRRVFPTFAPLAAGFVGMVTLSWPAVVSIGKAVAITPHLALRNDIVASARWIRASTPLQSHLFTTYYLGNTFAGLTGRTVFLGHGMQTPNAAQKYALVEEFFAGRVPALFLERTLIDHRIDYFIYPQGREEAEMRIGALLLHRVFSTPTVAIYAVAAP